MVYNHFVNTTFTTKSYKMFLSLKNKSLIVFTWQKINIDKVPKSAESVTEDFLGDPRRLANDEETLNHFGILWLHRLGVGEGDGSVVNSLHIAPTPPRLILDPPVNTRSGFIPAFSRISAACKETIPSSLKTFPGPHKTH